MSSHSIHRYFSRSQNILRKQKTPAHHLQAPAPRPRSILILLIFFHPSGECRAWRTACFSAFTEQQLLNSFLLPPDMVKKKRTRNLCHSAVLSWHNNYHCCAKLDKPLSLSGLHISHCKMRERNTTISSVLLASNAGIPGFL